MPHSISNSSTPTLHQSTALPCPLPLMTSGACGGSGRKERRRWARVAVVVVVCGGGDAGRWGGRGGGQAAGVRRRRADVPSICCHVRLSHPPRQAGRAGGGAGRQAPPSPPGHPSPTHHVLHGANEAVGALVLAVADVGLGCSSRRQQEAAGGSRTQQEAAPGHSRTRQEASGHSRTQQQVRASRKRE